MSERSAIIWMRLISAVGAALAVIGSGVSVVNGTAEQWWSGMGAAMSLLAIFIALFVWPVARREPRNAVVAIMAVAGFLSGSYVAGMTAGALIGDPDATWALVKVPADLDTASSWIQIYTNAAATAAVFLWLTFGLLLFPDGRLPRPSLRWLAWFSGATNLLLVVGTAWEYRPSNPELTGFGIIFNVALLAGMLAAAFCLAALIGRYRRSTGAVRQQFKWIVWGAAIFLITLIVSISIGGTEYQDLGIIALLAGLVAFVVSYGIALGKYRLYDIDVVISRTFVYGLLAVFITGVYVAAVVGVGSLLGTETGESPWLPIGATALVAFAFEPLRSRLQRLANRFVYGRRATPYEVLSDFSRQLTSTDEELLPRVARSLAEGTTARAAGVWLQREGRLERVAVWPEDGAVGWTGDAVGQSDTELMKPVVHDGESLGALTLCAVRGQTLLPSDERLLEQMAGGMGLALRNIRLSEDLRQDVEKLRLSRQRLLTAQDETRRHLERQLHDGAQQRLVALKLKLALTRRKAEASGVPDVAHLLEEAASETDQTVDSLRDFARGIYPPLLESEGLRAALASQVPKLPIAVTVHAQGVGRYSRALEAAIYFCILEALQNVVKHANAGSAHVALRSSNGALTFEVSDDGRGFDPDAVNAGSGLANLADRLDTLDGTLEVTSSPGAGTTVLGHVPVREEATLP